MPPGLCVGGLELPGRQTQKYTLSSFWVMIQMGLVSAEICEDAEPITSYRFDFSSPLALVVGNEESGVPIEILKNSKKIYIPMPGVGYCLNTSQTANIMLYEAVRQHQRQEEHKARQQVEWAEQGMYNLP